MVEHRNWFDGSMSSLFLETLNSGAKQTKGKRSEMLLECCPSSDTAVSARFTFLFVFSGYDPWFRLFPSHFWLSEWGLNRLPSKKTEYWELPSSFRLVTGWNVDLKVLIILWQEMASWNFLSITHIWTENFLRMCELCNEDLKNIWQDSSFPLQQTTNRPCDISFPTILASPSYLPPPLHVLASFSLLLPLCSPVSCYTSYRMIQFSSWRAQNNVFCFIPLSLSQLFGFCGCTALYLLPFMGREHQWTNGADFPILWLVGLRPQQTFSWLF